MGQLIGGILAILLLSLLLEWAIFKRVVNSAVVGKLSSVAAAYVIAVIVYSLGNSQPSVAIVAYLPGAIVWGVWGYIKGKRIDDRATSEEARYSSR
jgi:hypothetical protein